MLVGVILTVIYDPLSKHHLKMGFNVRSSLNANRYSASRSDLIGLEKFYLHHSMRAGGRGGGPGFLDLTFCLHVKARKLSSPADDRTPFLKSVATDLTN